ncbi:MAG TPA: ABC transporter substrate-binding protein, partial [Phycisphaerae bacterium]|nr:ABC transporter substrate-binding protein [Phycisphaerae bacterium]
MRRAAVVLILVVAIGAAIRLSKGREAPPADFRFISRASIHTLDPARMTYIQDIQACQSLWEGLTQLDAQTFEPIGGSALWPPRYGDDGRQVVFAIHPKARWSNGDPVTAHDFVRGWRRAIEPGTADVYAELISDHIAGAEAYTDWRTAWMNTLSVIRRLQKNSPVKAETLAKALRSEAGGTLAGLLTVPIPHPPPGEQDEFWQRAAGALANIRQNWKVLGDRLLDAHIAELEDRFARVGLRAVDDQHLEVMLARPTPYLGDLASFSTFMPIHESIEILRERYEGRPLSDTGVWAHDPQWTKPDYHQAGYPGLVTNGPYTLRQWHFKRRMRFEANPHYRDRGHVRSRTVESLDSEYQNSAFMLYEQGVVDAVMDLSMDYTPELVRLARQGKRDDIHPIPSFGTYYLVANCRPRLNDGRPNPCGDARVRRALTRAINRQEIVDNVVR